MKRLMNEQRLQGENVEHAATGGVSAGNRSLGFLPAFLDCDTMQLYPSTFADGRPAPFHILDGLPAEVVTERGPGSRVRAVKRSIISGFERGGFFYTRKAAARACEEWTTVTPS